MLRRTVVGAHYGFRDWLAQRITAAVMALYSVYLVIHIAVLPAYTRDAWRALFAGGFARVATFVFFMALFYHAWVGVRDIFMDYIKPVWLRLTLHSLVLVALVGYAGWVAQILWRL